VLERVAQWLDEGKPVALARVVEVVGSGVRTAGAAIALDGSGEVAGSASGGCVEGALVHAAREVLASGGRPEMVVFGCSDDEAFDVGLTCGGKVRALLERLEPSQSAWVAELAECARAGAGAALLEVVEGPPGLLGAKALATSPQLHAAAGGAPAGPLRPEVFGSEVADDALADLAAERSALHYYPFGPTGEAGQLGVFVDTYPAPPKMLIVGAASFTAALASQAKLLGYRVTVCDARSVFASAARFPMADEVVVDRAERYLAVSGDGFGPRDAICVLTHDPKFDVPTIRAAVRTRAGYIGVMGSRRTQADRRRRLEEAGLGPAELDRLRGPLGLDLGASSPEETAVSICAEMIALRCGRPGLPLTGGTAPVHPGPAARLPGVV
jgi:xanthine dehydrogenase accessory factor